MLVISVLCVLLPLVLAADKTCNKTLEQGFLAKTQLDGNVLDTFSEKDLWYTSIGWSNDEPDSGDPSVEVKFEKVQDEAVNVTFVYRDSYGNITIIVNAPFYKEEDHISALGNTLEFYFFQCTPNLVAVYRCVAEGATERTYASPGPKYFIWAYLEKKEADVIEETAQCEEVIQKMDETVFFSRRHHPFP